MRFFAGNFGPPRTRVHDEERKRATLLLNVRMRNKPERTVIFSRGIEEWHLFLKDVYIFINSCFSIPPPVQTLKKVRMSIFFFLPVYTPA